MDPLTQGLLGAAAAQAAVHDRLGPRTWLYGALGGMAADLDVLIRSSSDPMVAIEYHRHFTHSLAFIPIGGLLTALPFILRTTVDCRRRWIVAATTIGYATHGLLDAFTTYGTLLWWPFSATRVDWSWISIVDPLFTLVLAIGVITAVRRRSRRPAGFGLVVACLYLAGGGVQHHRARDAVAAAARERGHQASRVVAFPALATNLSWRGLYEADGRIWVVTVRTPWFTSAQTASGASTRLVTEGDLSPGIQSDVHALTAFRTFQWFTAGWLGVSPSDPHVIGDTRYSLELGGVEPLWGIRLEPGRQPVVERTEYRPSAAEASRALWHGIVGSPPTNP